MPRDKNRVVATVARVAVMEALERSGGCLKSHNSVTTRLISLNAQLGNVSNLSQLLRDMQDVGLIAIEEVSHHSGSKIVEAVIVEMPEHFVPAIARVRYLKGIKFPLSDIEKMQVHAEEEVATIHNITPDTGGMHPANHNVAYRVLNPEQTPDLETILETRVEDLTAENQMLRHDLSESQQNLEEAGAAIRALSHALLIAEGQRHR